MRIENKIVCRLWTLFWRAHLDEGEKVVIVRGWRTATIQKPSGARRLIQCMPVQSWLEQRKLRKRRGR